MRLIFEPQSELISGDREVELAITVDSRDRTEIYRPAGEPPPDRHYLVGLAESLAVAAEEQDKEMVEYHPHFVLEIEGGGMKDELTPTLVLARFDSGGMALVSQVDAVETLKAIRKVVRYFTGGIRLDVP